MMKCTATQAAAEEQLLAVIVYGSRADHPDLINPFILLFTFD